MKLENKKTQRLGYITGIGSGMTWGLDTVLIGTAMACSPFVNDPVLLLAGAFVCSMLHDFFAALWMLLFMGFKGELKNLIPAFKIKDAWFCILGAVFGGPLAMSFYMMAIGEGGPALTATVTAIYPLLGSAMAVFILKERIQMQGWIGLLICIFGIILVGYLPNDNSQINISNGIMLSLIAAIGWATEAVVCGYGMKNDKISPQMALLIRELTSALAYIVLIVPIMSGAFQAGFQGVSAVISDNTAILLIVAAAFVGVSSFLMWYTSINSIGAAKALCFNVTYSFWAVVFTFIFLQSELTLNIVIGSILIISGVTVATLVKRKAE
ncbi:DMT family transporter [Prevotella sp. HUN102]|uniref:DMT family transporter n=1 Tax=Prevotella sp. HUN102 TaxID=1392486 RepID=UPI000689A858|nr:DMT family transporter [Prevotella sp. HUN102]